MKKYVITYHAPIDALAQTQNASEEERAEGMKQWMTWAQKCGDSLVDLGLPLMGGQSLNTQGQATTSNRQVCGYSIIQAEDMDQAMKMLDGHPHLSGWDDRCEIEIHEAMPLQM